MSSILNWKKSKKKKQHLNNLFLKNNYDKSFIKITSGSRETE